MRAADRFRVLKAEHFIRNLDLYVRLYGRYRFATTAQRAVTALCRAVSGPVPFVLKVDLLHRCNLGCRMCYAPHDDRQMALEDFRKLVAPLRGLGCRLDLMGGEPFLYDRLEAAIAAARDLGFREVVVYTNGTRVAAARASSVKAAGLGRAMVNLSSHDPARHDRLTGVEGSWRATLRGIEALRRAGVKTSAFVVLHRENIGDWESIGRFVSDELGVAPVFFPYVPRHGRDELMPSPEDWEAVKRNVLYGSEAGRRHAATIASLMTLCGKSCLGGYYSFSVKTNGDVTPCPFIHDIVLGNAIADGLWSVFLARNANRRFREFQALPAGCRSCTHAAACGGGCRAGQDGVYATKDPRCRGPWREPLDHDRLFERVPTFF